MKPPYIKHGTSPHYSITYKPQQKQTRHLLRRPPNPKLGRQFQMDLAMTENLSRGTWTNEKHLHFLNTMEASFVRTMFENDATNGHHHLRLDRYLPDSSESTLDLKSQRRKKHVTSSSGDISVGPTRSRVEGRAERRSRRLSSSSSSSSHHFHLPSQDQVVPQLEDGSGDKDERGHHGVVAVTSMASAS